jgi:hypothetical protein
MTNDHQISASLTAQDMTDLMAAFTLIKAKLPFLINPSASQSPPQSAKRYWDVRSQPKQAEKAPKKQTNESRT